MLLYPVAHVLYRPPRPLLKPRTGRLKKLLSTGRLKKLPNTNVRYVPGVVVWSVGAGDRVGELVSQELGEQPDPLLC